VPAGLLARGTMAAQLTLVALADPAVRSRFVDLGFEVLAREQQTPDVLGALQKADAKKWWPIISRAPAP
jgi:hypothetical protein